MKLTRQSPFSRQVICSTTRASFLGELACIDWPAALLQSQNLRGGELCFPRVELPTIAASFSNLAVGGEVYDWVQSGKTSLSTDNGGGHTFVTNSSLYVSPTYVARPMKTVYTYEGALLLLGQSREA
jgi:hypothetical protein